MTKKTATKASRSDISRTITVKRLTRADAAKHQRADRWINERNKFGGRGDPIARTSFFRDFTINRELCDSLYRYDWLTRRAVDIPAGDSTRAWIDLKHDNAKRVKDAQRELSRLGVQGKVRELLTLSRLYGGAVMVFGAFDGGGPQEELGDVHEPLWWLKVVDRYLAYPLTFYKNLDDPKNGSIETYQVTNPMVQGTDVKLVHETRLVRMDGMYLPPMEKIRNFTWGASIIESILEATRQFGVCSQGLAGVVQDFVIKKLKVENLQELLQSEDGHDALMTRLGEMAAGMSMHGIATYGADEDFDKMGTPITGLPDIADRFVEYASAATGIPRSRLFNNLSGHLGGDAGENDLRVHYDNISSFQENELREPLQRIINVVLQPLGFEPDELQFEFRPLWKPSAKEQAETRLLVAQSDQAYVTMGSVEPEEVAMSRFGGDGINLNDMQIVKQPREKFLKELKTQATTPTRESIDNPPVPAPGDPNDPNADPNNPKPEGDDPAEVDGD